jgi:acetyl esterase/lipase
MGAAHQPTRRRDVLASARWLRHARLFDYALAFNDACVALPVIGDRMEPIGKLTAIAAFGSREAPALIASLPEMLRRRLFDDHIRSVDSRVRDHDQITAVAAATLRAAVPTDEPDMQWPPPDRTIPLLRGMRERRKYLYRAGVQYGDAPQQVLDVWRRPDLPSDRAPVLVFVPGGAWIHGSRMLQGYPLLAHFAERGWICVSIDYRVAPHHRWPRHIQDVKAALGWTRANASSLGGDPTFVAIAGCSAGGHLASLAGLNPIDPEFDAGLPAGADTSVNAVVSIYGRYDWADRSTPDRDRFVAFLERVVVRKRLARHRDIFLKASPIAQVRPDAPPFLVVHGSADRIIPVEQAQMFVNELRAVSHSVVGYLEIPGADHGFDLIDRWRAGPATTVIDRFLNQTYRNHVLSNTQRAL